VAVIDRFSPACIWSTRCTASRVRVIEVVRPAPFLVAVGPGSRLPRLHPRPLTSCWRIINSPALLHLLKLGYLPFANNVGTIAGY
jgi:hypothetical protein